MVKKKVAKKRECSCKVLPCLTGLVLMVVGFYLLITGFVYQLLRPDLLLNWKYVLFNWKALLSYLVGFMLIGIAKHLKMRAMAK